MMGTLFGFAPKPLNNNTESMACSTPRPSPLSHFQLATDAFLKRKRSDSGTFSASPVIASPQQVPATLADNGDIAFKRRKLDDTRSRSQTPRPLAQASHVPTPMVETKSLPAQQTPTPSSFLSSSLTAQLPQATDGSSKVPFPATTMDKSNAPVANVSNVLPGESQKSAAIVPEARPVASLKRKMTADEKQQRSRDIIQSLLNLEILLKHRELGDIECELAKCQVALEQLRRARLIPFPGSQGISEQVTLGKGAALQPRSGFTRPSHPTPWGVADGPYTRHYAQWLLPDPEFDSVPQQSQQYGDLGADARSTRGSATGATVSGSRIRHPSGRAQLQALNTNYGTPKERHGPLTVTRPSDGKLVKLVCKACGKENASSMQGFLNHCRIAHKDMEFKTHDEAIDQCGVPVEPGEAATASTPLTAPAIQTHHQSFSTPTSARPLLHPLVTTSASSTASTPSYITNAGRFGNTTPQSASSATQSWMADTAKSQRGKNVMPTATTPASSVTPSQLTPKLSALFQRRGLGGDLNKMVIDAKHKIDIESLDTLVPEDEIEAAAPNRKVAHKPKPRNSHAARPSVSTSVASSASTPAKPPSHLPSANDFRSAVDTAPVPTQRPTSFSASHLEFLPRVSDIGSPAASVGSNGQSAFLESPTDTNALSPRTVDTNPGMVTDHGDDADFDSRSEMDDSFTHEHVAEDSIVKVRCGCEGDDPMRDVVYGVPDVKHSRFDMMQNLQSGPGNDLSKKRKRGRPSKKDKEQQLSV